MVILTVSRSWGLAGSDHWSASECRSGIGTELMKIMHKDFLINLVLSNFFYKHKFYDNYMFC